MRMTDQQYSDVLETLRPFYSINKDAIADFTPKVSRERLVWDILHNSADRREKLDDGRRILHELYRAGLNDSHIYTGANKALKEIEQSQALKDTQ